MSNYITEIKINKVRHLENLSINLGSEKKHLILTGKNGSGKTSLLLEISNLFDELIINNPIENYENKKIHLQFSNLNETYRNIVSGKLILAFFQAKRENKPTVPNAIENITISPKNNTDTNSIHRQFIAYMVRLRNRLLNEKFDGNQEEAIKIEKWLSLIHISEPTRPY